MPAVNNKSDGSWTFYLTFLKLELIGKIFEFSGV
jgi:hypothetical protein